MVGGNKVVVVGAGVAGLVLAHKLSRAGCAVTVVEKEAEVGGLARSFEYEDGFVFDIGPHRFHTEVPEVSAVIRDILGDDCLTISRKSGVWMFDRYFEWPLVASSLLQLPFPILLNVGWDMVRKSEQEGASFEDYILSRYGKTLYTMFFKPYTEKFLKMPCSQISRDWAVTGIDRAVIDKNIRIHDLFALARSLIFSQPPLEFLYPKSGGIGVFAHRLEQDILAHGGAFLLNSQIAEIKRTNGAISGVVIGRREHDCDLLVWAGSLRDLTALLAMREPDLHYLSVILFNYLLDVQTSSRYQWCYMGSDDVPFNRISMPSQFNDKLAPKGKSGICVEVTCRQGDLLWQNPHAIEAEIVKALQKVKVINDPKEIRGVHIEKVANAYPIYSLDYADILSGVMGELRNISKLRVLGRTGGFWYNNMDHSIADALKLFRELESA